MERFGDGSANFTEAIKLDVKELDANYNRGIAYSRKGELDKANLDFTQSIKLNQKTGRSPSRADGTLRPVRLGRN